MIMPDDKVEIMDDGQGMPVAAEIEEDKSEEKVDDTTQVAMSKKEEEANARIERIEKSNARLMQIFTSPEFFAKLGKSMKPDVPQHVPTAAELEAEKQKLEDMSRADFLASAEAKIVKAAASAIKPEIEKLSNQMSTFISSQAANSASGAVQDFIGRVGREEFNKYGAAMENKAKSVKGLSMDEIYTLVSGKKAPKYAQNVIPNKTMKPGEGLKELTEQKDLSIKEAGSRNFDHIFGKYNK